MSDLLDTTYEQSAAQQASHWGVGSRLGGYLLERVLGKGGMGEVFAARRLESDQVVALKTLANTHPTLRYRFKREFRALADVEHPNLVRLGELVVPEQGPSFFTMELIEGRPFTHAVRGATPAGQLPDLARLEAALAQLVEGLECLHANQCVHRDVKPSNVLVSEAGRVVILDFGIISEFADTAPGVTQDGNIVGTPIYMAPEQATAAPAGPASDYYAVGVILYECLTGRVPFSGPSLQMLLDKQYEPTPDPREVVAEIPARLRDLCLRLLHRDPARRPSGPEILARLEVGERPLDASIRRRRADAPFVGREAELALLRQALVDVGERHQAVAVHVRGRSGHGKSALVQHFLHEAQRERELLVLRGRCRERETVPYKGVDAVVDALSAYLRRLGDLERIELRPRYSGALARVFPVLDEIWIRDEREPDELDPNETRGLGWAALRELLTRLADRCSLVVLIDDFQWTDLDSVAILQALMRQPEGPALLLLLTARDEVANPQVRAWLDDERRDLRRIDLGPLSESDARELALALLRAQREPAQALETNQLASRADAVALRCAGSPFFIGQMVLGGDSTHSGVDLDQIVVRRLTQLEGAARRSLEVVAVSGGPLPQSLVIELGESSDELVERLCGQGLLVRSETGNHLVEAAHDRIRELTLAGLAPERLAALHWQIGSRLLDRQREPDAFGDRLFEIVDHLDAGLTRADGQMHVDELAQELRLELAQLNQIAGERALGSAAWASARRYLGLGYQLVEPWLAAARKVGPRGATSEVFRRASTTRLDRSGGGFRSALEEPRGLCLAIAFGRAQAEAMGQTALADAAFADLWTWSLSEVELGQIVARQVAISSWFNRLEEAVDLGLAGLARLGLAFRRSPALPLAVLEVLRGWLALGRRPLEDLQALPELQDPLVRARLDVLVEVSFVAPYVSPPLLLALAGYSTRTIRRHGYHVGLSRLLTQLGMAIGVLGKARAAAALCDRALALAQLRSTRPLDLVNARALAQFMVWPASRSLRGIVADFEAVVAQSCDLGLHFEAGYISVAGGFYSLEIDRPLAEVAAMFDRFEARNPGFGGSVNLPGIVMLRGHIDMLVDAAAPPSAEAFASAIAMLRYMGIILEAVAWTLLGEYERATSTMDSMPSDYPQVLIGVLQIPRFAMYSAILEARRCPASGRGRRKVLRKIRRHAKVARQWAEQGPENFGPMADIIEGELARLLGRHERAAEALERARAGAQTNGALNLVALASLRLAVAAHARGHALTANAAFAAAIAGYEAWGAAAVVTRLRERGLEQA